LYQWSATDSTLILAFLWIRNLGNPFTHAVRADKIATFADGVETFAREVKANYGPTVPTWHLGPGRLWSTNNDKPCGVSMAADIEDFTGLIAGRSIMWEMRNQGVGFLDLHRGFDDDHIVDCYIHSSSLGILKACENLENCLFSYAIP